MPLASFFDAAIASVPAYSRRLRFVATASGNKAPPPQLVHWAVDAVRGAIFRPQTNLSVSPIGALIVASALAAFGPLQPITQVVPFATTVRSVDSGSPVGAPLALPGGTIGWFSPSVTRPKHAPLRVVDGVAPVGAPFVFAPTPFVPRWAADSPRPAPLATQRASDAGPVGQRITAAATLTWFDWSPSSPAGKWSSVRAPDAGTPGALLSIAPLGWLSADPSVARAARGLTGDTVGPVGSAISFAPMPWQAWTVEPGPPRVLPGRAPEPTVLGARILVAPPLGFESWSVEARVLPVPTRRVAEPDPVGTPKTFAPTAFQLWSIEAGRLPVVLVRVVEPADVGTRMIPPLGFQSWSIEGVRPRVTPRRAHDADSLARLAFLGGLSAWTSDAPRAALTPVRAPESGTVGQRIVAVVTAAWLGSDAPVRGQWSTVRAPEPDAPGARLAALSLGWLSADRVRPGLSGTARPQDSAPHGPRIVTLTSLGWTPPELARPPATHTAPPADAAPLSRLSFAIGFDLSVESRARPVVVCRASDPTTPGTRLAFGASYSLSVEAAPLGLGIRSYRPLDVADVWTFLPPPTVSLSCGFHPSALWATPVKPGRVVDFFVTSGGFIAVYVFEIAPNARASDIADLSAVNRFSEALSLESVNRYAEIVDLDAEARYSPVFEI